MWIVYINFYSFWSLKSIYKNVHLFKTRFVRSIALLFFLFLFFFFFTCLRFSRFLISLYLTISFFYFFLFQPLHPLLLSYSSNCSIRFRSWTFRSEVFLEDFIVQRPHFRLCLDLDFFLFSFFSMELVELFSFSLDSNDKVDIPLENATWCFLFSSLDLLILKLAAMLKLVLPFFQSIPQNFPPK